MTPLNGTTFTSAAEPGRPVVFAMPSCSTTGTSDHVDIAPLLQQAGAPASEAVPILIPVALFEQCAERLAGETVTDPMSYARRFWTAVLDQRGEVAPT